MNELLNGQGALAALLALPAGGVLGILFFRLLALNTRLYTQGRVGPAAGLHLLRVGGAGGLFVLSATQGPWALLGLLGGFLIVRPFMLRRQRGMA